eukprot:scaffold80437_cov63-Phaeocystis_antarctica.AAC.3
MGWQMRARDMDMRRGRVRAAGRRPHLSSAPLLRCTTVDVGEGILLRKDCASTGLRFAPLLFRRDSTESSPRYVTRSARACTSYRFFPALEYLHNACADGCSLLTLKGGSKLTKAQNLRRPKTQGAAGVASFGTETRC